MPKALPDWLTPQQFWQAVDEMRAVVGKDWVISEDGPALRSYRDAFSPEEDDTFLPSAVVAPDGVEQIQKILKIANDYRVPLWTISSGKNFAYGGPAPRKAGHVVLDLKRMNRILEVNEEFGYALVEPGVTYFQLYEYIQKKGYKLWIDPAAPGWGSVLGNTLEHGVGYTPYGDHFMMHCGMEVVLADGTVLRTGQGSLPDTQCWQLFQYGFGPVLDGIFSQSNFGVVTKMGMWLMPEPPGYMPFMITYEREEDLHAITEAVRPLKVSMTIPNAAFTVGLLWEASIKTTRAQYGDPKKPLPDSALKKIMSDHKLGMWNFYAALYGPKPMMDNTLKVVRDALGSIPGAKFYFDEDRKGDPSWDYRVKLMRGIPNMTEFNMTNWVGGSGAHVDFSPISPTRGEDAMRQYQMIKTRANEYGFDYLGEFAVGWRDMHHVFSLTFDRADADERRRARELFNVLIDEAAKAGYGEYRTHLAFMDKIAGTYNWNDGALWKLHHRLKDALDPNGILAPGKMGIWPRHMREEEA
ncbi:MAG TPA: oxidoreductase [Gammaproteobacteria bacterium]|uniref:FAD-binding oxidoreductase n=1 Tax=Immundisolibacter sp. TaxID=1934948 RepID=UPI000E9C3054|nr:oxidoreductase [Gammaproteobacteria bacterium]HCZ49400.1 oxidoreductase [Gammaproteobacteria bacterium]MCH78838.1 oxidoreductase [Gammaproteobacteria bacterium]